MSQVRAHTSVLKLIEEKVEPAALDPPGYQRGRAVGSERPNPFAIHLLVLLFHRVQRYYRQVATVLRLGQIPPPPMSESTLVIVPGVKLSRLTAQAVSEALSLGDEVVAVTVAMGPDRDHRSASRSRPAPVPQPSTSRPPGSSASWSRTPRRSH